MGLAVSAQGATEAPIELVGYVTLEKVATGSSCERLVDQTEVVATDTFDVDRKVSFVVTRVSDPGTTVSPGQQDAVIAFEVTNLSNDTIDLVLAASQPGGDDFDADNVTIYVDDGNGTFDAADTATTLIDQIAEDATMRVFVVSDIGPVARQWRCCRCAPCGHGP